jgi:hypothetical protein
MYEPKNADLSLGEPVDANLADEMFVVHDLIRPIAKLKIGKGTDDNSSRMIGAKYRRDMKSSQ